MAGGVGFPSTSGQGRGNFQRTSHGHKSQCLRKPKAEVAGAARWQREESRLLQQQDRGVEANGLWRVICSDGTMPEGPATRRDRVEEGSASESGS